MNMADISQMGADGADAMNSVKVRHLKAFRKGCQLDQRNLWNLQKERRQRGRGASVEKIWIRRIYRLLERCSDHICGW